MEQIANYISVLRMFFVITLTLVKPLSIEFFVIYLICGTSDFFDGYIARKNNTVSELGAKLDSIADLLMVMVMMTVIYPIISPTVQIITWIAIIGIVRLVSMLVVFMKYRTFGMLHTYCNKITGFILFILPFFLTFIRLDVLTYIICILASISAIEELIIHIFSNELELNKKSIFLK